jgi:hypothetical protein
VINRHELTRRFGALMFAVTVALTSPGQGSQVTAASTGHGFTNPLESLREIDVVAFHQSNVAPTRVTADVGTYRGRRAIHMVNDDSMIADGDPAGGQALAILRKSNLRDGSITLDVVAWPRQGARPDTRGFVGVAFHVQNRGAQFEAFYLRFTNGRAEDQLRRNHAAQYVSEPEFPWYRLRREDPGEYESYVDIEQEAWTRIKLVVQGSTARLYVNGAAQPCLIVHDLKLGAVDGPVALWNGADTEAYFSNLHIEPQRR